MAEGADLAFGLATSVGPVPFASVDDAVDFALRTHSRFPTVPVTSAPGCSLLDQAVHGLDHVAVLDGALAIDGPLPTAQDAASAGCRLDSPAFDPLRALAGRFADGVTAAPAAIRVPLLGPVTLATQLRAAGADPADAARVAASVTSARAVSLLLALRRGSSATGQGDGIASAGQGPVAAVVLDEPGLVGSMHPTFPMLPTELRSLLDPVVDALDRSTPQDSLLIGVHVPGPCDWPTVVGCGASLLSVPVDRSLTGWAPLLGDLLERGGRITWGAVPVDRPLGASEEPHWQRLLNLWTELVADGVDPMLLRLRSSFSPADGLEHFGASQAELVMDLTVAVAERVRHQAVAARLSLGA